MFTLSHNTPSLAAKVSKVIEQDVSPIIPNCKIFAASREVDGGDMAKRCTRSWPVRKCGERRQVDLEG